MKVFTIKGLSKALPSKSGYIVLDMNHPCHGKDYFGPSFGPTPDITLAITGEDWNRRFIEPEQQMDPYVWILGVDTSTLKDIGKDPRVVVARKLKQLRKVLLGYEEFYEASYGLL